MWQKYNPNPIAARVGDCVIRAISKVTGQDWVETYLDLCVYGLIESDLPSSNHVWGKYLKEKGYTRELVDDCTVAEYCETNKGKCVLAIDGHVVACEDDTYFDSWDSANEIVIYCWRKKDE